MGKDSDRDPGREGFSRRALLRGGAAGAAVSAVLPRSLYGEPAAADHVDRTAGANPIRQPLANLDDAGSLYGAIIYQKAPIVMRQLEGMLGAHPFREGVRAYLDRYRFANAS